MDANKARVPITNQYYYGISDAIHSLFHVYGCQAERFPDPCGPDGDGYAGRFRGGGKICGGRSV